MNPALVSMVKDEADIIYYWLLYYYNRGIRNFYIIDNNSTDGTRELIQCFYNQHSDIRAYLEIDEEIAYWQYRKINRLAERAVKEGCDWILPVDADELFFVEGSNQSIPELLSSYPDSDVLVFEWWHYRPSLSDNREQVNPFQRITHRDRLQNSSHTKIFCRYQEGMEICQGNHQLHSNDGWKIDLLKNGYHAHFKVRSKEQLKKKVLNFGKAYEVIREEFFHQSSIENYQGYLESGDLYIEGLYNQYVNECADIENVPFDSSLFTY